MNLKRNYGSVSGGELKSSLIDKAKGIRNFNLYMKKGSATIMDKSMMAKNAKSVSNNDKLFHNAKVLNESTNKYKPIETQHDSKQNPTETSFTNNNIDIKISVNYPKQKNFNQLGNSREENNASLSNILMKDIQSKESMLKNLKNSISEDKKIRRKIYSNEKDLNNITIMPNNEIKPLNKRNPSSNQEIIQNNLNISLLTYDKKPIIENMYNNTTTNKKLITNNDIPCSQSFYTTYLNKNKPILDNSNFLRNSYTLNNLHKDKANDSSVIFHTQQDQSINSSNIINNINSNGRSSNGNIKESSTTKVPIDSEYLMKITNLEKKMDEMLSNPNLIKGDNLVSVNAKKFSVYKKIFDDYNSILQCENDISLSKKIASGYNSIVKTIFHQYSNVIEKLSTYGNISKKLADTNKLIEDKNNEILLLRSKLKESEKTKLKSNTLFVENNIQLKIKSIPKEVKYVDLIKNKNNNNDNNKNNKSDVQIALIENSEHNKLISELNINMIDDLEALYFNDKVQMRSNSSNNLKKVPKLNFKVVDEKQTKGNHENNINNNGIVILNNSNKIDEEKKHFKEFHKQKNFEIHNKDIVGKIENNTKQINSSFLTGINNNSTKNYQGNVINYNFK